MWLSPALNLPGRFIFTRFSVIFIKCEKKSSLAPDSWSDDKIIDATNQVACTNPLAIRLQDRATLHRQTIDSVDWVVIKDALGNVISSYPTGGQPIQF